jgi:hypothetical protein
MSLSNFWEKYVLTDVKGAFEGGSAAVGIAPAFAAAFPIELSIIAAIGVVVGAGITSGIAYAESAAGRSHEVIKDGTKTG